MQDSTPDIMTELQTLFDGAGAALYFGEAVTEREHALQSARLADEENAADELVVAALLHDVGHLLHGMGEHVADAGIDARHEDVGHAWLSERFPDRIAEAARLHVAAKRYLCATNADYFSTLSPVSVKSLQLQGGPMTPGEVAEFEALPWHREALRVRSWDDKAKRAGWNVPALDAYEVRIRRVAKSR